MTDTDGLAHWSGAAGVLWAAEADRFDRMNHHFAEGVMFLADPHVAFVNLTRGLRPGGRLVFTCWQDTATNEWVMVPAAAALEDVPVPVGLGGTAAHGAFSLADPETTTALLEAGGLDDVAMTGVDAPNHTAEAAAT